MTVTYTSSVSTSSVVNNFLGLLVRWVPNRYPVSFCEIFVPPRWRGSIYKLVWRDMLIFLGLYTLLAIIYRLLMAEQGKKWVYYTVLLLKNIIE